ncbi:CaiB/BaiF CoA-transferase family protein [Afipia sp. GAS231]|uniref:CaiB/BaiF CoA transferase family protein n=1 Tax=Afipia sp. GAS231 TaxID=1882747 RepID=UPI00087DC8AD|nr:CaiB/BaiF CoA-transferase family protein [Afipia sp. GAS231]SDP09722.1 Crotonobetainyl-CoA:carnitine CoA-transferase CaiB [Afipia sp. GAS231]
MHKPVDKADHAAPQDQSSRLPLSRFKVLDLTLARAGPSCVRTLADWGADVIRVEPPPEAAEASEVVGRRDGSDFQNLHRNKRAITLNLKTDEGREVFMRLAEKADVIVENMRPSVAKRLGVDFESVRKRNPRIVYGSISGFGQYGPYAERPSIDQIAQGMTGIMSVTGFPGQGPLRVGVAVTDVMAGAFLAQGVLIALLDREVSGEGRWVQTSLLEAGITLMDFQATRWTMDKKVPPQEGNHHPTNTPMGLFPTADGFLNLAATSNKNFAKFCKLIDREKMGADPRFATAGLRSRNREALNELITAALRARSSREWFEIMVAEGLPCGPVYNVKDVFADPQVQELRIKRPVTHPRLGEIDLIAQPCEITGFDRNLRSATPDLGEHNDEVLRSLGYDDEGIEKLKAAKAI